VTLNGMLKYPWLPAEHPTDPQSRKFGAYWSDREDFRSAQGRSTVRPGQRTLEAELMDWSDDITYAVHDLEDLYRVGLVPLDRLRTDGDERRRFFESFFEPDGTLRPKFDGADPAGCATAWTFCSWAASSSTHSLGPARSAPSCVRPRRR
jgi:hypothetical protein